MPHREHPPVATQAEIQSILKEAADRKRAKAKEAYRKRELSRRKVLDDQYEEWRANRGNPATAKFRERKRKEQQMATTLSNAKKKAATARDMLLRARRDFDEAERPVARAIIRNRAHTLKVYTLAQSRYSAMVLTAKIREESLRRGVTQKFIRAERRAEGDRVAALRAEAPNDRMRELTGLSEQATARGDKDAASNYTAECRAMRELMARSMSTAPINVNTATTRYKDARAAIASVAESRGRAPVRAFDTARRPGEAAIRVTGITYPPEVQAARENAGSPPSTRHEGLVDMVIPPAPYEWQPHDPYPYRFMSIHVRADNKPGVLTDKEVLMRLSSRHIYPDNEAHPRLYVRNHSITRPAERGEQDGDGVPAMPREPVNTLLMYQRAKRYLPVAADTPAMFTNTAMGVAMHIEPGLSPENVVRAGERVRALETLLKATWTRKGSNKLRRRSPHQYRIDTANERLFAAEETLELRREARRYAGATCCWTVNKQARRMEFVPWHPDDPEMAPVAQLRRLVSCAQSTSDSVMCPPEHYPYASHGRPAPETVWGDTGALDLSSPTTCVHYTQSGYFRVGPNDNWMGPRGEMQRPDDVPWSRTQRIATTGYSQGTLYITLHNWPLT